MKWCLIPLIFVASCKPVNSTSQVQYAVQHHVAGSQNSVLRQVLDGRSITACLINEDPGANAEWLNRVEASFRERFRAWLEAGARHPRYPMNPRLELNAVRLAADDYLRATQPDPSRVRRTLEENRAVLDQLLSGSGQAFLDAFETLMRVVSELSTLGGTHPRCPQDAIVLQSFSQEARYREYWQRTASPIESQFTSAQWEEIGLRYCVIKTKSDLATCRSRLSTTRTGGGWANARASYYPPKLSINASNSESLGAVMAHELGHLFGLGDVYMETGNEVDLLNHPRALMGNHNQPDVNGTIQQDDTRGLFAVINVVKGEGQVCSDDSEQIKNEQDIRSLSNWYCLPKNSNGEPVVQNVVSVNVPSAGRTLPELLPSDPVSTCPSRMNRDPVTGVCCPRSRPRFDPVLNQCTPQEILRRERQ